MKPSMNELMKFVLAFIPQATFEEDSDGQIVINTNLQQVDPDPNQPLVDMGD